MESLDSAGDSEEILLVTPASALIGYAVLRANYNAEAPSYLDNFQPFILSVLARSGKPFLEKSLISEIIHDEFGISIPSLVVGKLIRRTNRAGLTTAIGQDAVAITDEGLKSAPAISEEVKLYERKQQELVEHFRTFVENSYPNHVDFLLEDLGQALAEYFDRQAVPLLNEGLRGRARSTDDGHGLDFLVSAFVSRLAQSDQARFAYVVEAAKGAMLASVLVLDTSGLSESLSQLSLVLDTPVMMDALGFHGPIPEAAAAQVLTLARNQGAKLVTFEHSVGEVQGILESIEASLRRGSSRSTAAGYLHFAETGKTPVDLAVHRGQVSSKLKDLGVKVIARPDNYYDHGLDEGQLEDLIQKKVRYWQDATRVNDVMSLSSVHRLRHGTRDKSLERCRAVLVSSNTSLVAAAVQFERARAGFPLAITIEALASILWVRTPAAASDVPKQVLLAAAYAGMQPSVSLWSRYLDEVEKLEKSDAVTTDEAIILRSSPVSRETIMEETLGDPDAITAESPKEVLSRIKSEATAPLIDQLSELSQRNNEISQVADHASADWLTQVKAREEAENQVRDLEENKTALEARIQSIKDEDESRRNRILENAQLKAKIRRRRIALTVRLVAVLIVLGALVYFLTLSAPEGKTGATIVGVAGFLSIIGSFLPKDFNLLDRWERRHADRIAKRLLANAGFELTA
ncbi:hypothetical protein [Arthrobacter sp. ISL-65]|uniref:hypothetical protein n=1 Tax=Arthrobacter sp. ISL-65 TaxID=2819112 RepID=UPI001BEAA5CF|nr:hypothetical protein [Arthrobacter sp. ISL-65]MBT2547219.1 hypothetical protein [Arthrobacter sp. ISL-65]